MATAPLAMHTLPHDMQVKYHKRIALGKTDSVNYPTEPWNALTHPRALLRNVLDTYVTCSCLQVFCNLRQTRHITTATIAAFRCRDVPRPVGQSL